MFVAVCLWWIGLNVSAIISWSFCICSVSGPVYTRQSQPVRDINYWQPGRQAGREGGLRRNANYCKTWLTETWLRVARLRTASVSAVVVGQVGRFHPVPVVGWDQSVWTCTMNEGGTQVRPTSQCGPCQVWCNLHNTSQSQSRINWKLEITNLKFSLTFLCWAAWLEGDN